MSTDPLSKMKSTLLRYYRPHLNNHSSTNLSATGNAEHKSDLGAGHASSPENAAVTTQLPTINVVLFGETGVGKSSVINLIARRDVARVSSDVNGCTMQSTRYDIPFSNLNFSIFDTIGLEEPQMGVNGYLQAIEKAYELIVRLNAAGGIHLLLFCMRGGRITATTQSNYRLFCECLCNTKVPIALVFTGLEREMEMEDWWTRNRTHIEHYGIKSDGHACITAVHDDAPGEDLKYTESQKRIRELLKTCALKNEAFQPEPHSWFAKFGREMRSFIEKRKKLKRKDMVKVLTHRCKLDPETAKKIALMMEKDDTETSQGEQTGNDAPPSQLRDDKPEPYVDGAEEEESDIVKISASQIQPDAVEPEPRRDGKRGKEEVKKIKSPPNQLDNAKPEARNDKKDGGQSKRYGSNWNQPLGADAIGQAEPGGTRNKPAPSTSPVPAVRGQEAIS